MEMAERQGERESVEYIDCEVPQEMTLREWRCGKPAGGAGRGKRLRAAAAAVGRAAKLRRRAG
jgi:hypothetical protein